MDLPSLCQVMLGVGKPEALHDKFSDEPGGTATTSRGSTVTSGAARVTVNENWDFIKFLMFN